MFRSGFTSTASYRAAGKADRLLRAAATAFCGNPRPTRREITQFDDLTEPLLDTASDETLRFMAATLSQSSYAPPALVRRLAALPVEISAPLLIRSPALTPIDLLALIARHGLNHARTIALRPELDERILRIIGSIDVAEETAEPATGNPADETRDRLRTMMQPAQKDLPGHINPVPTSNPAQATDTESSGKSGVYLKLRSEALTGTPAQFHTALAEALAFEPAQARAIIEDNDIAHIIIALRTLPLSEEEAFLIIQCICPLRERRDIIAFLDAWQGISQQEATRVVCGWRKSPANTGNLKAS